MAKYITIIGRVKLYMFLWNTLGAVGILTFLIRYKLNINKYFSTWADVLDISNTLKFVDNKWGVITLSALYAAIYVFVTIEAKFLENIGDKLFSHERMPVDWRYVKGRTLVTPAVVLSIIIILGMAWFVDNPAAFCAVSSGFYLVSAIKYTKLRDNARHYLAIYPPIDGRHKTFILARREAFEEYLFNRPQLCRILLMAAASAAISIVGFLPYFGIPIFKGLPYLMIGAAMALNEYIIQRWRLARNRKLDEIDRRETEADVEYDKQLAESATRE